LTPRILPVLPTAATTTTIIIMGITHRTMQMREAHILAGTAEPITEDTAEALTGVLSEEDIPEAGTINWSTALRLDL
jgi:hypothetical protein